MYDVMGSEDMLSESGMGDITVGGAMYHVSMTEDGMLMGARYDAAIHTATDMSLRIGLPTLSGDDDETVGNEKGTMLKLNGEEFPISDLLEGGMAELMGKNFVAEALAELQKLRDAVDAYISLDGTDDDTGDYDMQIRMLWNEDAQGDVNSIFGMVADTSVGAQEGDMVPVVSLKMLDANDDAEDAVEVFDALITALSAADAFAAATEEDGDGVLEKAALDADKAMEVFDAVTSMSAAALEMTENTRFGAYWQQERNFATDDLKHVDADQDTDPDGEVDDDVTDMDIGKIGVFAYSLIDDVTKTIDLPTTGNLQYMGETVAVTSGESPTFYFGEIEIQVRLVSKTVHGLVSNLRNADGDPWVHQFGEVDSIRLAPAKLGTNADWSESHGRDAYINYSVGAGSPPATQLDGGFTGELTGQEDTDDPARAAHGTWWIAESQGAAATTNGNANNGGNGNMNLLTAAYGAEQVEAPPEHRPDVGAIDEAKTKMLPADGADNDQRKVAIDDDGQLVLTLDPDTNAAGDDVTTIKVAIASLMENEETTIAGDTHVAETIEFIENQRSVLEGWIALDAVDGDGSSMNTLEGRDAVWIKIRNRIVGGNDAGTEGGDGANSRIFMAPGDRNGDDTPNDEDNYNFMAGVDAQGDPDYGENDYPRDGSDADDVKGLAEIDELLEALSSADDLEEALDDGGIFHDGNSFSGASAGDIYGRVVSSTKVLFSSTDYTRFGAWRREASANAEAAAATVNGEVDDQGNAVNASDTAGGTSEGPAAFAFSPLDQTKYASYDDPSYPIGGTARYSGETIAVQLTAFYQGTIDIVVMWADTRLADGESFADGNVAVTISNLVNADGVPLTQGTNDVASIVISGSEVTTRNTDNQMGINIVSVSGDAGRVVHANRSMADAELDSGSLMGKFVGKTIDGPVGVIGTWNVRNAGLGNGGTLRGAFGAEASGP
jgi:hypothetical protein